MFIELRGQWVNTVSFGSGEPAIVGVAGAIGTWEVWQQPFELLSRRHRVVAYDHFGAGATRVPAACVTFEEQVLLLEALFDALDLGGAVLAADSSMVAVGVEFALRHPERLQALALVAGGVAHRESRASTGFAAGLRRDLEPTLESFVAACIPEADALHLRPWLADIIRRTGGERAAAQVESFYGVDLSARLPELRVPVMVIQGEHDALPASRLEGARAMASAIPDCRLEVLAGAGHVPTLTRPREVAEIIEKMAARTGQSTAPKQVGTT